MTDVEPPEPPAVAAATQQRHWIVPALLGFAAGVIVVGGAVGAVAGISALQASAHKQAVHASAVAAEKAASKTLSRALSGCSITEGDDADIADGGYTLTINGEGNDDFSGVAIDDWACLTTALKTPQSVVSHIDQTTSLDGRQSATWGDLTLDWTYHPDRGLDGVFTLRH
jgi:hypothetical protein